MRKSEVHVLQGLLFAILDDYVQMYPSDTLEVDRDRSRLSLAVQTRGQGVFLLDLPALGKHFDKCLSDGVYTPSGLALSGLRWKGSPLPKLFSGMMSRVFERESGCLQSTVDVEVVRYLRQIFQFAKGYRHDCSPERTKEAVLEFYQVDREIWPPTLSWASSHIDLSRLRDVHFVHRIGLEDLPQPVPGGFRHVGSDVSPSECGSSDDGYAVGRIRHYLEFVQRGVDYVCSSFGPFLAEEFTPRQGRGAVSDLSGKETKYSFPGWSEKLDRCFPYADFAFANYGEWADTVSGTTEMDPEAPSKLLCVPKTAKGPRLIASEPTSHQWCQQILLQYFVDRFAHTFLRNSISLEDQGPSRILALRASQDGSYATIDLSMASDRISTWLVERFFRANTSLIDALHASRSRWIVNGSRIRSEAIPDLYEIRKFTTMGSACTFPVQSLIFTTLCILTILFLQGGRVCKDDLERVSRQVRVFGDDIIIPTKYNEEVRWMLSLFGLKVNLTKSFATGNFRESCGMDAFCGYDVTPAHLNDCPDESRPNTLRSVIDASNNFHMKGYWRAADYLVSTLPRWVRSNLPVVSERGGRFGLVSYCGYKTDHLRKEWDVNTQQDVVRCISIKTNVSRYAQPGQLNLFQWFVEKPNPEVIWEPGRVKIAKSYIRLSREPLRYFSP